MREFLGFAFSVMAYFVLIHYSGQPETARGVLGLTFVMSIASVISYSIGTSDFQSNGTSGELGALILLIVCLICISVASTLLVVIFGHAFLIASVAVLIMTLGSTFFAFMMP